MMQYNISPETLIEPATYTQEMRDILSQGISVDKLLKRQIDISSLENATLTPNGQFFRTDMQGFLPKMMEEMYEDRKKFKKLMIQAKKEYEVEKDDTKKYEIEGHLGSVAFITTMTSHFCGDCNRLRLTAEGKMKNCLFGKDEVDLLSALRGNESIETLILESVQKKHQTLGGQLVSDFHKIDANAIENRSMIEIGG
jgi:molybdenum cofactor biosynthesis enzyme MoaA